MSKVSKPQYKYVHPLAEKFPELFRSDVSINPSYSNVKFAYDVICRQRYCSRQREQKNQFARELLKIENMQSKALDGVRIHREFSQGVLSHKLPTKNHMDKLIPDPLTPKERRRLEEIMKNNISGF